jgi:hypothetical protein
MLAPPSRSKQWRLLHANKFYCFYTKSGILEFCLMKKEAGKKSIQLPYKQSYVATFHMPEMRNRIFPSGPNIHTVGITETDKIHKI